MQLMPEQVLLLQEKQLIQVAKFKQLKTPPTKESIAISQQKLNEIVQQTSISWKQSRSQEIKDNLDRHPKHWDKKQAMYPNLTREEILELELKKIPDVTIDNVHTYMESEAPDYLKGDPEFIPASVLEAKVDKLRFIIFKDLWERGFYLSDGLNFGGDFLAYIGDPNLHHAALIVKCFEDEEKLEVNDLIGLGRLGNTVKKKMVFASVRDGVIKYLTFGWNSMEIFIPNISLEEGMDDGNSKLEIEKS